MNANPEPHAPVQPDLEGYEYEDDGFAETLPVRPRRPFLTKWTAALMALALGGAGFLAGVRLEKSDTSAGSSGAGALASSFSAAGGRSGTSGSRPAGISGGFPGASGGATVGSVSSVKGDTIYVKESSGDTVAVELSSSTKVTKSESVARARIYPGDEVVISGSTGSKGTIKATAVTDSGASATSSSTSAGSSSSSTSSAVSGLFGGA